MEVTLAQADALKRLRESGYALSKLRPHGRAVVADFQRRGCSKGTVVIAPSGNDSRALTPDLLFERAS